MKSSMIARVCLRLWCFFSLVDPSCLTNTSVIVTSPRNVTVCAGASAEFRCVTSAALLQWSVDGVEAYRSAVQMRNISFVTTSYSKDGSYGYTSTLTVYGSIANGNSSIKCSALYGNVLYESDVAILVVQGSLMASVNAAAIGLNSTHVLLTWGPPGDAINPALLNYIVVIRNGSATRGQLVTAVNETSAIVSLSLLSKCDTSFIIQPMCSTTAGNTTSVQWYSDGNSTIKVTTELTADAAKITILGIAMCTIGYYRVAIANSRQNWNMNVKSFSDGISFDYLLSIGHNEKVFANVILYNDKLYKNGRVIAITTFDVTSARLLEPTPRIQCSFNLGSTAKGCLALFDDGNRSYYLFVRRNSTSADEAASDALQGVPSGNYTLLIYDVEVTGTPSSSPALSDNVSITGQAFTAADEADKKSDVMVSIKNSSICIDCGSNGCLALIRALPSAELYSVNSSQCVDFKRSEGSGSYSVAVFAIGYDGAIMNRPIVNQQINLYSKSESRNANLSMVTVGVPSQFLYIESTLSVCCALLLVFLIITLVALVSTYRVLKRYKAEFAKRGAFEMNENEAYSSICATCVISRARVTTQ